MAQTSESVKLTKTKVDKATSFIDVNGRHRQKLYFDKELKGFGLCVGQKAKTFFAQRAVKGRAVRVTIGRYGVYTVAQVSEEAIQLLARMAKGENPNETKRLEKARGITLQEAFDLYVGGLESKGRSSKTIEGYS